MSIRLPPFRYLLVGLAAVVVLHTTLSYGHAGYGDATSLKNLGGRLGVSAPSPAIWEGGRGSYGALPLRYDSVEQVEEGSSNLTRRANAAFVVLARNSDVWEIVASIRGMEDRFNRKYHYPYVFLNDEPFTDEFKRHTSGIASAPCSYGLIPKEQWEEPSWIDEDKASKARAAMEAANVIYGGSVSYRRMCRFQSLAVFMHPLMDQYEYYWRIEPSVKFFCDINYDPFLLMSDGKKKYGFVVTIYEYAETIVTLWDETKKFISANPQFVASPNSMDFVSDDGGETYNRCHFWSNFEIGSLDFFRSEAYTKYFEHLDRAGGFSYERWGDAPVHSIAASLFLKPEEMHFFQDIGYRHEPFQHCPKGKVDQCACNPEDSFEDHWYSCTPKWKKLNHLE